ncbi:MAG: hypothetical protein JRI37_09355 [Deltaproteobacteria bacterium]|nr:hypothetical protein [Deltaproteobacteria bacterium]
MREFFVDITEKNANKNNEKAPEGTQALPCSSYLEKALEYEKKDELQTALFYLNRPFLLANCRHTESGQHKNS